MRTLPILNKYKYKYFLILLQICGIPNCLVEKCSNLQSNDNQIDHIDISFEYKQHPRFGQDEERVRKRKKREAKGGYG